MKTIVQIYSNEPVTVYTSPEEWKNKIALDINIKKISGNPNSINPDDFNFYYNKTLEFNEKTYQLFSVKILSIKYIYYLNMLNLLL